jgi:uncharacterized protein
MDDFKIKKINIGHVGDFEVGIPFIKIGQGSPKITILTGIHGDEHTGLLIIKRLLDQIELKKGTLQLILSANPLAKINLKRESSIDLLDLNRIFPGKKEGSITERMAHKLTQILCDNDLVIDLHTMKQKVKPTVIFVTCNTPVDERSLDAIKAFNVERVWKIKALSENNYNQSLGSFLARQMIPHFALETEDLERISQADLNTIHDGLENVMANLGMVDKEIKKSDIKSFKRNKMNAGTTGVFIPLKEVDAIINFGDVVGNILSLQDFKIKPINSLKAGFISDIKTKVFVHEGDHIFSIGEWENGS